MKLQNLIENLKLSAPAKAELDSILSLPEVKSILGREEAAALEKRKALISELEKLPAKFAAEQAAAAKHAETAAKNLATAEEILRQTREVYAQVVMQSRIPHLTEDQAAGEIRNALWKGRDPRLLEYKILLSPIENACRNDLVFWSSEAPRDFFTGGHKRTVLHSNVDALKTCAAATREVLEDIEKMSYSALTRDEITERLTGHTENLLKAINSSTGWVSLPVLDKRGEVRVLAAREGSQILRKKNGD